MIADEKDFKFLNEYDFVYLYILPVGKVGNWWWYDLPEAVRKDFNGMIVLHFDYEGIMYKLPPFLKESINANVDVLGYTLTLMFSDIQVHTLSIIGVSIFLSFL